MDNVEGFPDFVVREAKRVLSLPNEETMGLKCRFIIFKKPVQVRFTLSERPKGFKNYIFLK